MAEDLNKLPKWARERIEYLERDLEYVRGQNALSDAGQTRVKIGTHTGGLVNVPDDTRVQFSVTDEPRAYVEFSLEEIRPDQFVVSCRAVGGLMMSLVAIPYASNLIRLRQEAL